MESLKEKLKNIISDYPQLKIQLYLKNWQTDFLRFYKSQTNYNISKNSVTLYVSIYKDKKNYSFEISNPSEEQVRLQIEEALIYIDKLPPDPYFIDLENDLRRIDEKQKDNNIENISLNRKIEILKHFAEAVKPYDFDIYGTFICNNETNWILNSNGLDKVSKVSPYYFEVKAVSNKNEVTVLESFGSDNASALDTEMILSNLIVKIKAAQNEIVDVEAGDYEVILAPRCIGDFLSMYAWSNLFISSIDRKNTELDGKVGEKVFPECFSLYDNPRHPNTVNYDYSHDGHLYQNLPIFEKGIFKNFLVNNYYAHKLNVPENGNEANCLVMETGNHSLEDMIKGIKKGLYISSFHYMNFINSRETSLTGLTRDGTFLIEDGKITKVINNLRFTEKITDVINNIQEIENKASTFPMSDNYGNFSIYTYSMPHIKVKEFNISSSTKTV
ncbi:MAG: TldD/PmbA family protein [Candidatus Cloacimonetes bacterium]|jgi:predicted Zn-dependent protease|nr:TldD/PmbA family protein [Candidatus Cloacimonadota bacterium]MDD4156604.1 TldD/PmbA family protein [Candidatus Cloacimonadota bacterium]